MKSMRIFLSENFPYLVVIYLNRCVCNVLKNDHFRIDPLQKETGVQKSCLLGKKNKSSAKRGIRPWQVIRYST